MIKTKEEFIKTLQSMGYVTNGYKFYEFSDKNNQNIIGMKVGEYEHSCNVDSSDIAVFVCLKRNNNEYGHLYDVYLEQSWHLWLKEI